MSRPLWSLNNLSLGHRSSRLVIDSLIIPPGVTAIMGPSGAGKTSLLNLLVQFEQPLQGHVPPPCLDENSHGLPLFWVTAEGAFWPHLNVAEHLEAVRPDTLSPAEVQTLLQEFDLSSLTSARPETLSMGERTRLAILLGLVAQPHVLVMDEPLVHVDDRRARHCWNVLTADQQRRGSHLIFSSHSPETILAYAQHVICLEAGRVVWSGAVSDLYWSPPTRQAAEFLGPVNWFDSEEVSGWLGHQSSSSVCLRPERTLLQPDPAGELTVQDVRFLGSREEVQVTRPDGKSRTLIHRPARPDLRPGMLVHLKTLLTLLACCLPIWFSGCGNPSEGAPVLHVTPISHRPLPPEGIMLPAPRGMTYSPENELYVLDNAGRILVFNDSGEVQRQWWMPEYSVGKPERACVLRDGRIAIADTHYHRIVFFSKEGEILDTLGSFGEGPGQFIYTVAVTQDDSGHLYVAEYGGHDRVQKFTLDGQFLLEFGSMGTEPGQFQRPSGMFWHDGAIYVADAINNRIQVFGEDGEFIRVLADAQSAKLHYPYDIALAPDETIYVAEYGGGRIARLSLDGKLLGQFGKEGRRLGEFWTPWGIAVSPTGRIAVADTGNRRMVELEP